jgi:hypothetical protein
MNPSGNPSGVAGAAAGAAAGSWVRFAAAGGRGILGAFRALGEVVSIIEGQTNPRRESHPLLTRKRPWAAPRRSRSPGDGRVAGWSGCRASTYLQVLETGLASATRIRSLPAGVGPLAKFEPDSVLGHQRGLAARDKLLRIPG